jgi:hypothetical protein
MNEAEEEWRPVEGWPYEVSSLGRIRCILGGARRVLGRILVARPRKEDGYCRVTLFHESKSKSFYVHRLVCAAFHGPPPSIDHEAAHQDGLRGNNREDNLRWETTTENRADEIRRGVRPAGELHNRTVYPDVLIDEVRRLYVGGVSKHELSRRFGISRRHIGRIVEWESRRYRPVSRARQYFQILTT